jgi:hypothetical protein
LLLSFLLSRHLNFMLITFSRAVVSVLACCTLVLSPGAQTPSSDVSVGVFPFLVGDMDSRIGEIVTNCQVNGVDTLYVSVFRATGPSTGSLWIDDSAGAWMPSWGPVRPGGAGIHLPNLIAGCHAQNIRVVAVLKCFDSSVQPSDTAHSQYLLGVIDYLTGSFLPGGLPTYDLDGIALDYVRFVSSTGANSNTVTAFVADVRDRIGSMSLHAYLVANRFSFDGPVYDSQFQSYAQVRGSLALQFGQDWQQLAPLLDVLMPMAYTADGSIYSTYAGHQGYVAKTAEYARLACVAAGVPTRRVVPVVKTYTSSGETTTVQTIDASVTGALNGGGNGYQSFRYQLLVNDPTWWGPMAQHAVPGCNWPRPSVTVSCPSLTSTSDAAGSSDVDQASASLLTRYDFESDGIFDTPWQVNAPATDLAPFPGPWTQTVQVRDAQGHVATTRRRFSTGSPLTLFPSSVSTISGGLINVFVDAGPAAAGHTYLVLASLSGGSPGFIWGPGYPVPLNIDALTNYVVTSPNGGLMSNGLGSLNGLGRATARLQWPPQVLSFLAGLPIQWSFVAQDIAGNASCVGDQAVLQLQ